MIKVIKAQGKTVPLVFDSPHSGTSYPDDYDYCIDYNLLRRAEDTHVHELYDHVPSQGALFLKALFPRSYIDLNRSLVDVDNKLLEGEWPHELAPSAKTEHGIGLIWRRIRNQDDIYNRKLSIKEVEQRINKCWKPYHQKLENMIRETHDKFGVCYHIDCHSMPSQSVDSAIYESKDRADFVLGDRDGSTCKSELTEFVAERLKSRGYSVTVNDPYKGAELVRAYANPANNIHSLQIEINRALYMNEDSFEKNSNYANLKIDLEWFTGELSRFAAE